MSAAAGTGGGRRGRTSPFLPALVMVVSVAGVSVFVWAERVRVGTFAVDAVLLELAAALGFATVGALVVAKRPGTVVGWMMCGIGVSLSAHFATISYWQVAVEHGWPGGLWAAWYASFGHVPYFLLLFFLLPLLFPTGRPPSPRWRVVAWAGSAFAVLAIFGLTLVWSKLYPGGEPSGLANPTHVPSLAFLHPEPEALTPLALLSDLLFAFALFGAFAAVVVRFRRSSGVERQQMKWFLAAVAFVPLLFVVGNIEVIAPVMGYLLGPMLFATPAAIGVAVLRYRLYEIDRLLSRTVTYATVAVSLVGVYWVGVLALGTAASGLAGDRGGDLAVAASTLLVAALFKPVRDRIRRFVDRRFDRTHYDAQLTAEAFSQRLRDEVDLDALAADLIHTATATVAPRHATTWLAPSASRSRWRPITAAPEG